MSQTYPLMRGTAPLLVAVISVASSAIALAAGLAGHRRHLPGDSGDGLQRARQLGKASCWR
jgi:hypothetical protein